jgi:hypothetical protein
MKTTKLVFLILTCFGLLFGCNQFEMPDDDLADLDLKKAVKTAVFIVEPSGGDDTPAILQAFDNAKAAGPGSVVQLCQGEYFLGFLEIRDFYGSFKGAGKNQTIITAMNNLDLDPILAKGQYPDLIKFVGGDVMISHFTIQTPPGRISVGGLNRGYIVSLMNFSAINAQYYPLDETRSLNVVLDNVYFKGQILTAPDEGYPGDNYNYNCGFAFGTANDYRYWTGEPVPRQKVDIKVTNTEFETFWVGAWFWNLKNSKIVLGEKNKGNTFNNIEFSTGIVEGRDNEALFAGNTFNIAAFGTGLFLDDYSYNDYLKEEIPLKSSIINITDNAFNTAQSDFGLVFRNIQSFYSDHIPTAIQVINNQFNMTDSYDWAIASHYSEGMVIRNNRFTGHGDIALFIANHSKNGLFLGNNYSTATFETCLAFLDPTTSNWTFVGGNYKGKVIDLGVNNVFTGMNVSTADEPLGRSISEKLVPMNHLMK